jgi:hypothetical protein
MMEPCKHAVELRFEHPDSLSLLTNHKEDGMTETKDDITRGIARRLRAARCFRGWEPDGRTAAVQSCR